ncbi:MAG: ACT domain-containing protein [Desulfovibrio sp.]|uniref:ACT domain-containing protein n=1 Tax=Desulfovibrio sp. TaxID=885 RepID=UPI002A35D15F|nr:ACT domain-containing protein [Desulfovibrio sp.]MDY0260519.1 ACT domain-containing protein [Desulfovibrio sp.]
MRLEVVEGEFTVSKVSGMHEVNLAAPWLFIGRTDAETSVVCLSAHAPVHCLAREDGWRAFRVAGQMDFGLTGVLAGLATVLARASVSIFALSTFDTDYILVKKENLSKALEALASAGHEVEWLG